MNDDLRSVTFLNETGDVTFGWSPDMDANMLAIIQKKMDEGMTFFIIEKKFFNLFETKVKVNNPFDVFKSRNIVMDDDDFREFVNAGDIKTYQRASATLETVGVAQTAIEVVKNHTVGITARAGG